MNKLFILLALTISACATPKTEPTPTEETNLNVEVQINEDSGIMCKENNTIACNEIRDYCFNNDKDEDCVAFAKFSK
jgi:lipoprotein